MAEVDQPFTLSEVANFIVASAAVLGLFLTAAMIRVSAKASDVESFISLLREIITSERNLYDASTKVDESSRNFLYNEHFNILEAMAQLYMSKAVGRNTREICRDALINHLSAFRLSNDVVKRMVDSVTDHDTYESLSKFYSKHKNEIDHKTTVFEGLLANRSSSSSSA